MFHTIFKRITICTVVVFIFFMLPFTPKEATAAPWESNGPNGGQFRHLVFSPAYIADQTAFGNSRHGLFKTINGGVSWTKVHSDWYYDVGILFSPDYQNDKTIFYGKYKSTDGGISWIILPRFIEKASAISPNYSVDKTIFSGRYKSIDGGSTWAFSESGLPSNTVQAIGISPNYAVDQTLFAGTYVQTQNTPFLFKSTDAGATWFSVKSSTTIYVQNVKDIVVSPNFAIDQTVFAGTDHSWVGTYKSTDGGQTWSMLPWSGLISRYPSITSMVISPDFSSDQTLFIA